MNRRSDPVYIWPPCGELGKKAIYLFIIGVKDMRAIDMDQYPICIRRVICIAADMRAALDDFRLLTSFRKLSRDRSAGKAAADH